ncbi:hypothetical protein BDF20DRAFT_892996 [Mycotypha africana]|uniref:uncharacterized protein n=1 Tax=Mycotypha africana TaxID=64632 RepID=UPI00230087B5|nr:uncharacterized protein BDF20DRAFT_892996 [Mycotypha africana]KAI8969057.1 hypothetical protein BDF20DRAFT_892996 [Mycotypha africana]
MSHLSLEKAVGNYSTVVHMAKTDQVAVWDVEFIKECMHWCIFIETEMSVLTEEQREATIKRAKRHHLHTDMATPEQLLDALHHFFYLLLDNTHLNNQVYLFIIKNYQFLNKPDQQGLCKDLTDLARQSATTNILEAILRELNST